MGDGKAKVKVSGLRLTDQELGAIARARQTHSGTEKRKHRRLALPDTFTLLVRLDRTGGSAVFSVVARDLGAEGVGFFHTSFIHPGTAATFLMRSRTGDSVAVQGVVKWCQHVGGRVHEVGAVFEQVVKVDVFVEAPPDAPAAEAAEPEAATLALCGRVAALADELKTLASGGAALEALGAKVAELAAAVSPAAIAAGAPVR